MNDPEKKQCVLTGKDNKKKANLFFSLVLFAFLFPGLLHAQRDGLTLTVRNVSLKQFFDAIEKQTSYTFSYRDAVVEGIEGITTEVVDQPLQTLLEEVLSPRGLEFKVSGQSIVVTPQQVKPSRQVTGTVTDASGEPIIGANVIEKGTTNGTITDIDGQFSLNLPEGATLQFTYIGYQQREVKVDNRRDFSVRLQEDTQNLEEVIVVGYGIQKKVSTTSAVAQIKSDELTVCPTSNVQQTLQGLTPGLTITDGGGVPGRSSATVRVRGITTIIKEEDGRMIGTNDPLILIDGVEQRFDDINPNDIESISILKDAASAAIYGSRAANGVILVTTKRAKAGEIRVNYNGTFSLQKAQNTPTHMGLEDYMRYQNMAYINSGAQALFSEEYIKEYVNATDRIKYPLPNVYFDEMFRIAPMLDNSVSVSGGSDNFKGLLSLRHKNEEGILSHHGNEVTGMRVNTDFKKGVFTFNADADYRYNFSKQSIFSEDGTSVINHIYHGSQWAVPQYPDGSYGISKQGHSPVLYNELGGSSRLKRNYFVGNLKMDVDIWTGLKATVQYSAKVTSEETKNFLNAYEVKDYYEPEKVLKKVDKNSLTEIRQQMNEQTFTGLLNYTKTIQVHEFNLLAGYSQIKNTTRYLKGSKEYFYSNDLTSMDMGGEENRKISGYDHEWGLRSYFGRVNYNYDNHYLLEVNARWDGSSRFTGSGVYAFFPSASAAWRISQEKFWKENDWINDVKVRASWGKTGNQAIPLYEFYPAYVVSNYTFGNEIATGYLQQKMSNKDLTWETTTQTDIGLDLYALKSRLGITLDYYNKVTDGILLALPIPGVIGLEPPLQNAGSVLNRGVELMLTWRDSFREVSYSVTGNLAVNKNKIQDLAGSGPYKTTSSTDPMTIRAEGLPIDSHWGYLTGGLFQTQEEVDNYPTLFENTKPGDVKYLDLNGDGKITPEDMTYLGNTFPKYTFGLNGTISWKGFELYMQWQGAADVDVRLTGALIEMGNQEGFTHEIYAGNVWTPENPDARFPRPVKFDLRNVHSSDRVIFDGSYLRLKTLQLAYTIPQHISRRFYVNRARVSLTGTNLLTFSALNEWNLDPEIPSGRASYYPQTSVYSLGINLEF